MSYQQGPPQSPYAQLVHATSAVSAAPALPPYPTVAGAVAASSPQWSASAALPTARAPISPVLQRTQLPAGVVQYSPQPPPTRSAEALAAGPGSSSSDLFIPTTLQSKSRADLTALLSDDATLTALCQATHPTYVTHDAAVSALAKQIHDAGIRIAAKQQELATARGKAESELVDARALDGEWRTAEKKMNDALRPYTSASLRAQLASATTEAENISEALAGSFLDTSGNGGTLGPDVGQFVREYRRVRKIFHLRKERLDRWNEERVGGAGRVR
ncbi:uncharacterized protein V1518DRAFT_409132 [Limtongia smithiae]|uniref:uncharacterized protein n=1 Tax=Limtongia smithiae TaxID=1125753 RepID=UPI0034CE36D8